jgi:hypothetical protein
VTTNGVLSYKLNLQLRRDSDKKVEKYVHSNPNPNPLIGTEILCTICTSTGVPTGVEVPEDSFINNPSAQIRLYPNPVKDLLNIDFGRHAEYDLCSVSIFDIIGRPVMNLNSINPEEGALKGIDLSPFPEGIYILKIASSGGKVIAIKRFIKNI